MWEIASRLIPYEDRNYQWIEEVREAVVSGVRPTMPANISPGYRDLMTTCWSGNPEERPSSDEVAEILQAMLPLERT